MLKIKEDKIKDLEKFGFKALSFDKNNFYGAIFESFDKEDYLLYKVVVTAKHKYIQIRDGNFDNIAKSLQTLIYNLTKADMVEVVEDEQD